MKISIITAAYNSANTIEQTLSSTVNQSYANLEHIVIDGGSADGTLVVLEKYGKRYPDKIRYISEPDKGIYDALNKGVLMADGDYIQILGSDDCLYDYQTIDKIVQLLKKDIDVLCTGIMMVSEKDNTEQYASPMGAADKKIYDGGYMIPHAGMFVRREIFQKRLFDTSFRICADYDFFLSVYYDNKLKFAFQDFPVAYFSDQGVSSKQGEEIYKEQHIVWEKHHLQSHIEKEDVKRNKLHNKFKRLLKRYGLYEVFNFHLHKSKGEIHRCDNEVCRWCGRK